MKNFSKYIIVAALTCMAMGWSADAQTKEDWGDFKLFIDPGHSKKQNQGMYNYTEAEKVLRVALNTRAFLYEFTTATENTIHLSRDNDEVEVELAERSDMANAWGADFFYSIHSDAGESSTPNKTVFLFGGWYDNGTPVEKTPKGGKRFAEMLDVNLTGVMYKTGSRGPWYDRYFYDRVTNHTNKYPYLSVNRRSNMASMLSEGGYHTHPVQQALNINDSYKRLEAFGTFRSILEDRGINRPDKVMLAGVVTNSETGEAINNVTVKVDGQTVVTDSYESIFHNYTPNPDLIHNGFFLFEGLTPGQSYQITYSCPG
ncbi:MAG: N-acetylmuramoyl-L-alanine amidase [Muribaculaceae bacterium]|nr:N-acetylmuramoyl-L-alanine amidase [Muribaculaceae bacterium]